MKVHATSVPAARTAPGWGSPVSCGAAGRTGGPLRRPDTVPAVSFLEEHLGSGTWRADPPFSSVTFKVRHLGARDYRAGLSRHRRDARPGRGHADGERAGRVAGPQQPGHPRADAVGGVPRRGALSGRALGRVGLRRRRRAARSRATGELSIHGHTQTVTATGKIGLPGRRAAEPREPRRRRAVVGRRPARLRAGLAGGAARRRRHARLGRHARGADRVRRADVVMRRLAASRRRAGARARCPPAAAATTATAGSRRPGDDRHDRHRRDDRAHDDEHAGAAGAADRDRARRRLPDARRATGCRAGRRRSTDSEAPEYQIILSGPRGGGYIGFYKNAVARQARRGAAAQERAAHERRRRRAPRRDQHRLGRPARPGRSRERPRLPQV